MDGTAFAARPCRTSAWSAVRGRRSPGSPRQLARNARLETPRTGLADQSIERAPLTGTTSSRNRSVPAEHPLAHRLDVEATSTRCPGPLKPSLQRQPQNRLTHLHQVLSVPSCCRSASSGRVRRTTTSSPSPRGTGPTTASPITWTRDLAGDGHLSVARISTTPAWRGGRERPCRGLQ
jgi:hypothetical protein